MFKEFRFKRGLSFEFGGQRNVEFKIQRLCERTILMNFDIVCQRVIDFICVLILHFCPTLSSGPSSAFEGCWRLGLLH